MSKKIHHDSFLNARKTIDLPSNLLNLRKNELESRGQSLQLKATKVTDYSNRYFKTIETPASFVGQKNNSKDKQVLYKRLSNIRGENKQISNLSFSKMLSRMVVLDDQYEQQQMPSQFEPRMRQTLYVTPIPQKLYSINCRESTTRAPSRSIDLDETTKPSRKLFKKYYMPSSQATQTFYFQTGSPRDKYIYRDGKKVECKRIHNFYTSHMFRTGYGKLFRKTADSFKC